LAAITRRTSWVTAGHTLRPGVASRSRTTTWPCSSTTPGRQPARTEVDREVAGHTFVHGGHGIACTFRIGVRIPGPTEQRLPFGAVTDTASGTSTFSNLFEGIVDNIATVVHGKREAIEFAVIALLAEGHLLIEDVPGCRQDEPRQGARRVDRLQLEARAVHPRPPPDRPDRRQRVRALDRAVPVHPGPLFANIVLADEINRASPKTQSALLEAMEERQVSADGVTHRLDAPFMVIATQNPVEQEGTYRLPESQLDRFLLRISIGYPGRTAEMAILDGQGSADVLRSLRRSSRRPRCCR
jgi:hypothetical protein